MQTHIQHTEENIQKQRQKKFMYIYKMFENP